MQVLEWPGSRPLREPGQPKDYSCYVVGVDVDFRQDELVAVLHEVAGALRGEPVPRKQWEVGRECCPPRPTCARASRTGPADR